MPVFIPILIAAAVGAGTSIAFGYATENTVGDKDYTAQDAAIDGILGAAGFSAIKGAKSAYQAAKYANYARKARKAGKPIPHTHRLYGESLMRADAGAYAYVSLRHAGDSATHLAPLGVGVLAKHKMNQQESKPTTTIDMGDRTIRVFDPIVQAAITLAGDPNRSMRTSSVRVTRAAPKTRGRSRRGRACRCKDGSYSVNCC